MLGKVFRSYASRGAGSGAGGARALEQARACLDQGRAAQALELIDRALFDLADAYVLRIEANFLAGNEGAAVQDRQRVLQLASPRQAAEMFHEVAAGLWRRGREDAAMVSFSWALIADPACEPAAPLPGVDVHGEWYLSRMDRIHQHLRPRTYLEIGVAGGDSLVRVPQETLAIGVDPAPSPSIPAAPNRMIFAQTSDEFFARQDVRALLGGRPLDLAFIDGMHRFEYALRDFMNIERLCSRDSTVLVHDCYPATRACAERERCTRFWTGDVWRLVLLLQKHRPDLSVHTVAAPPSGLAVIRGLDPDSRVIAQRMDALVAEYLAIDYAFLDDDKPAKLNLVRNDWDRIAALLPAPLR